jgi:hypothetical protein
MTSINSLGSNADMQLINTTNSDPKNSGPDLDTDIKDIKKAIEKELLDIIKTLKLQDENQSITSSLL